MPIIVESALVRAARVKASNLVYAAIGYTLGARAGHERYEQLVRTARRVAGSQTVQSTAGVAQARLTHVLRQARTAATQRLNGDARSH